MVYIRLEICMADAATLAAEIEQFARRDLQRVAHGEDHIQGNGTIGDLDAAHMCAADIYDLRKLHLGQPTLLAIKCDVESQLAILFMLMICHKLTPCYSIPNLTGLVDNAQYSKCNLTSYICYDMICIYQ